MNDVDLLKLKLEVLTNRVKQLERWIRPVAELEGVDAQFLGDQGVVAFVAENLGSSLLIVTGPGRTREESAARARVAHELHRKLRWSTARIGRHLNRTEAGIRKLLESHG